MNIIPFFWGRWREELGTSVFEQVEALVDVVLQHLGIDLRGGDVGVGKHAAHGLYAHTT